MPNEEFRISDWNWIGEHFEPSKAERMAKVAWSIANSNPETIPKHSLTLDPLIVIPLCAIVLQDDINISVLRGNKSLRSKANEIIDTTSFELEAQFIEEVLSAVEPSPLWRYLFYSLHSYLQFDLLYCLINYRRPTIVDWLNLFREVKYEFKSSWHYRLVLFLALVMSILAIIEGFQIIDRQPDNWINGLVGLAILVVIVFWVFLWRGIEEKLEPTSFTSFGLFGFWTFWSNLYREKMDLARTGGVLLVTAGMVAGASIVAESGVVAGIGVGGLVGAFVIADSRSGSVGPAEAVTAAVVVAGAWGFAGATVGGLAEAVITAVVLILVWAGGFAGATVGGLMGAGVGVVAGGLIGAVTGVFGGIEVLAVAMAMAVAVGLGLAVVGASYWVEDIDDFLAVFAFPFFCWLPIVIYFSTLALLRFLSWQQILLIWLTLIGFGTALWLWGQKLEEQARNPLQGILIRTEKLS